MKIILASSSSGSRGGGELYLLHLGRALVQHGHEVTLWASAHPRMDELANSFSPIGPVIRSKYQNTYDQQGLSLSSELNIFATVIAALDWKRSGADFVHLNTQFLEDGLNLLRAARLCGIPNLCTIQLTQTAVQLGARLGRIRDSLARRSLRKYPGLLVTIMESRRKELLEFIGQTPRVRMIHNGVPLFDLRKKEAVRSGKRPELGVGTGDTLFVAAGRMVTQKRPLLFLEMAERILRTVPTARFLWIGDGPFTGEWDKWVAQRNLGEVIRRCGWQPDVQPLLLCADVFMHVAEFEGIPLALLEAMSAEVPAMVTGNLVAEMPFLNESNAITVEKDSDWHALLQDRKRLAAIAGSARKLCEQEFSHLKMAENYEMLYDFTRRRTDS
jgi:glycosyltransferase involved in cell wall biosynthesis